MTRSTTGDAPLLVASAVERFLAFLAASGRSSHTIASCRHDLAQLARFLGRQPLVTISTDDLRAFSHWLRRQHGNRTSSLRRKTSTVKRFFHYLHSVGEIPEDPSERLSYPPAEPRDRIPLSPRDATSIADAAHTPAWRALILCLLDAGLKRDEVVALRWEDVDLDAQPNGRVTIRHRAAAQRARRRTLALTHRLRQALETHQSAAGQTESVFDLSARGVDFVVETCARRAGVRPNGKVTPQMLRDAYACRRMAELMRSERADRADAAPSTRARENDVTLLRELGLSDFSSSAARYRRLVRTYQQDRSE